MPQRYVIVAITAFAALWLYIDRVCFSTLADPMTIDLRPPARPASRRRTTRLSAEQVEAAQEEEARGRTPRCPSRCELTPAEIDRRSRRRSGPTSG